MQQVEVDLKKCTGCSLCELACSIEKEGVYNPAKARLRVRKTGLPVDVIVISCKQCYDAPCAEVCPSQCVIRDENTGALLVDEARCVGCGLCVEACEFEAIKLHPSTGTAIKCDLCFGEPKCVKRCPRSALTMMSSEPGSMCGA